MTPEAFLTEVVRPNLEAVFEAPDDLRTTVNAILTLDALAGILHAHGKAAGRTEMAAHERDDDYREALAHVSSSFRLLRDAAASLKHGELTDTRKKRLARLVRRPDSMHAAPNVLGLFQCGDEIEGDVVLVEFDPGPNCERADVMIADSYRMLSRIVAGELARTDENDRPALVDSRRDTP